MIKCQRLPCNQLDTDTHSQMHARTHRHTQTQTPIHRCTHAQTHTDTRSQILTVDKLLLVLGADADQVGVDLLAALLGLRPGVSLSKVEVTAALELQPALSTALHSYTHTHTTHNIFGQKQKI